MSIKVKTFFILIIFAAIFIRFYNFENRVTFWSEQARSLIVSSDYLIQPSLLGQEYFRSDSFGHRIFSGAVFNYLLVPLILIFDKEPIPITAIFALLNIITGLVTYYTAARIFNQRSSFFALTLFLFNDYMIYHSLFIWNYNLLPLVGILTFYLLWLNFKNRNSLTTFFVGLLGGFGVSLQVLYAMVVFVSWFIIVAKSKSKFVKTLIFALGIILGNFPMVLFDLRHDFYHLKTLTQYLIDSIAGNSDAGLSYYYFLPLWPIMAVMFGVFMEKLNRKSKILSISILVAYLIFNLLSSRINFTAPTGMPEGVTVKSIQEASTDIVNDADSRFNVASVLDFDKRAFVLRYFTKYYYGKAPLGVTEYENPDTLYVLSEEGYDFTESGIWEIKAGSPYNIEYLTEAGGKYAIYKLTK